MGGAPCVFEVDEQGDAMPSPNHTPEPADVAAEMSTLSAGLGILTIQIVPFSLPLLVLVIGPLLPLIVVGLLLAAPFWLGRAVLRRLSAARGATGRAAGAASRGPRVSPPARARS
jgi:hypothetical protein